MKNKKQKVIIKNQKNSAKKELATKITDTLMSLDMNFANSKKIQKLIKKNAKQLAKKISSEVKSLPNVVKAVVEPIAAVADKLTTKKSGKKQAPTA